MYNGTCPVCMRTMHGFICPYCESSKGIWSEVELSDDRTWVPISPDDDVVDAVPSSTSIAIDDRDSTPPACGEDDVAISCRFESEVVPSLSSRPRLCTVFFFNPSEGRTLTVRLLCGDREILRLPVRVPPGSSDVELVCSKRDLSTDVMAAFDITVMVSAGGAVLFRQSLPVKVRPLFDMDVSHVASEAPKWVTPNDKAIKDLLTFGGPILKAMGRHGEQSLKGYQGGKDVSVYDSVIHQLRGIYEGLSAMGFAYAMDTYSFGNGLSRRFQRVKTPGKVLEDRTGVCIEYACLFASIIEAVGLYPILVFPPGHAMAGVVVSSRTMPRIKNRDMAGRDHVITMEINADSCDGDGDTIRAVFIETTDICSRCSFEDALRHAEEEMSIHMGEVLKTGRYSIIYNWRSLHSVEPLLSEGGDVDEAA